MTAISDEILMAYVDGELDAVEMEKVEKALSNNPDSWKKLRVFLASGRRLERIYDDPEFSNLPDRLVQLVGGEGNSLSSKAEQNRTFAKSARFAMKPWFSMLAMAAVLAVGIGLGAILNLSKLPPDAASDKLVSQTGNTLIATGVLNQALEKSPSGLSVSCSGAEDRACSVRVILTFRDSRKRYCREYAVAQGDAHFSGLACRSNIGEWQLLAHTRSVSRQPSTGKIVPASGQGNPVIGEIIDQAMVGDALLADEEQTLIRNNWSQDADR